MNGFNVANQMAPKGVFIETRSAADWYEPERRTVHLCEDTAHSGTMQARACAAHECGHAVQHALRTPLWRLYRFVRHPAFTAFLCLAVIAAVTEGFHPWAFAIGASALLIARVFVVLAIERDASNIALAWLELNGQDTAGMRPYLRKLERSYVLCTVKP